LRQAGFRRLDRRHDRPGLRQHDLRRGRCSWVHWAPIYVSAEPDRIGQAAAQAFVERDVAIPTARALASPGALGGEGIELTTVVLDGPERRLAERGAMPERRHRLGLRGRPVAERITDGLDRD